MTSRRPNLCTKQLIGGHVCVQKKNPVGIELFSHVKTFFYSRAICKAANHVTEILPIRRWFTRTHYLVLRKFRSSSRPRLRI